MSVHPPRRHFDSRDEIYEEREREIPTSRWERLVGDVRAWWQRHRLRGANIQGIEEVTMIDANTIQQARKTHAEKLRALYGSDPAEWTDDRVRVLVEQEQARGGLGSDPTKSSNDAPTVKRLPTQ